MVALRNISEDAQFCHLIYHRLQALAPLTEIIT